MGESNKATVKIYGQEYTIAGNSSGEQIVVVANHVDTMMQELAAGLPTLPASSLAVLTAVNIANDYFDEKERIAELESVISDLKKDANHYIQMWQDAKSSFKQYKEDAQNSIEQLQELQRIYNMKNVELNKANEALESMTKRYEAAQAELGQEREQSARVQNEFSQMKEELSMVNELFEEESAQRKAVQEELSKTKEELAEAKASRSAETADANELMSKYKELENSFFDIQMENLQLKNDLDKLRKQEL